MSFLAELIAELFGWFGRRQAAKDSKEGNKKRAIILPSLFLLMLTGIFIYIIYGSIRFFMIYQE